jgi:hypothetical protein
MNGMTAQAINLENRISVESLRALAALFKSNPHKHTKAEIAAMTGIAPRTAREVMFVYDRRPDLVEQVFADDISLYRAGKLTRSEPNKWQKQRCTRF